MFIHFNLRKEDKYKKYIQIFRVISLFLNIRFMTHDECKEIIITHQVSLSTKLLSIQSTKIQTDGNFGQWEL